jgi:hypothetical protein
MKELIEQIAKALVDSKPTFLVQSLGEIVAIPEVGELHHWYQRLAA